MTFHAGKLIDEWGKPNKKVEAHLKRRKWIIVSILCVIFLLLVYFVLNNVMGMVFRPVTSLNSAPQASDWAMFGRNPLHSAGASAAGVLPRGTVKPVLTTGSPINSSPVIVGSTLYIGSRDGNLYAMDIPSGSVLWKFKTGSWVESSAAVVNNVVYVGSNDGKMYALAADSGRKIWEYSSKFVIRSSPAVAGGLLYFGSNDFCIHALKTDSGKQAWQVNANADVQSSPVVSEGILYVGTGSEYFYAIDALHGSVRNQFNSFKPVMSSPVVKDGVVYFCSSDGYLYAMDGQSKNWFMENRIRPMWSALYIYGGAPRPPPTSGFLWSLPLGDSSISSPSIEGNNLYVGAGRKLVSVDLQNYGIRWEAETGGEVTTTPLVAGSMVYVTSENGHLYVFDSTTGEQLKDIEVGGIITTSPAIYGSTIYVSSQDGTLYAVE
jgi:eukaryotic-like serine/threonine-protein kinase